MEYLDIILKELRVVASRKQTQVALEIGKSEGYVSEVLSGKKGRGRIFDIAEACGKKLILVDERCVLNPSTGEGEQGEAIHDRIRRPGFTPMSILSKKETQLKNFLGRPYFFLDIMRIA